MPTSTSAGLFSPIFHPPFSLTPLFIILYKILLFKKSVPKQQNRNEIVKNRAESVRNKAFYNTKNALKRPFKNFLCQQITRIFTPCYRGVKRKGDNKLTAFSELRLGEIRPRRSEMISDFLVLDARKSDIISDLLFGPCMFWRMRPGRANIKIGNEGIEPQGSQGSQSAFDLWEMGCKIQFGNEGGKWEKVASFLNRKPERLLYHSPGLSRAA